MKTWDWNIEPMTAPQWELGDQVWVDHTLYDVAAFDGLKQRRVVLEMHKPITVRAHAGLVDVRPLTYAPE